MSLFPRPRPIATSLLAAALALTSTLHSQPSTLNSDQPSTPAPDRPSPNSDLRTPISELDRVTVFGRGVDLLGEATAASTGQVGAAELAARPFLRRGELLEVIPGVVITQHSGSGKANQYFLRGFNLDHGTDFAITADGLPVNLRTHAHGQGYSDLNFLIPETVAGVTYQKGQYDAAQGDFSAAGAAQFHLVDALPQNLLRVEFGENDYARLVAGATARDSRGAATTVAVEAGYDNGPWTAPEHSRRFNLFTRHTWSAASGDFALTLLGYRGEWDSTDQVPARAIASGRIDRFGALDPTDGGVSDRASLSFDWTARSAADTTTTLNLYAIAYRLNLFSNFTYFLDDPVDGDQFNQRDRRQLLGGSFAHTRTSSLAGRKLETTLGAQTRTDFIDVGLFHTAQRAPVSTVRGDDVREASAALYAQSTWHAAEKFRATAGLRADGYAFHVASDQPLNSGDRTAAILSPKLALAFGPWSKTELYLDAGEGFHSNDARGTTIRVDPSDGVTPVERVSPLVRARSVELGLRTAAAPGLVSTVSLWALQLDSELVFVGDGGATEPSGATRRYGVEFANYYRASPWLAFDADLAFTHARYVDAPGEDRIANSLATVLTAGATLGRAQGVYASLRLRYFGPQPLIEDNSVTAPSSLTFNLRLGWRTKAWDLALDVLNVLDRANIDIAYYYASRLPGEPAAGIDDVHLHPAEPRTFRLSLTRHF